MFADFLESVPRDLLAEVSPVVVKALYKPLLDAWPWLPPSARNAFWGILRPVGAVDRACTASSGAAGWARRRCGSSGWSTPPRPGRSRPRRRAGRDGARAVGGSEPPPGP